MCLYSRDSTVVAFTWLRTVCIVSRNATARANVGKCVWCSLVVICLWHRGKQVYMWICATDDHSVCVCVCVRVHPHMYCLHAHLYLHLFLSVCVCVCVCWSVAVWCRPIKTWEIDDQGLWVAAAAAAVADSCFLQTTGNEMALFSWRCQHQHHWASKTNHHLTAAARLLLHLPTACSPLSTSISLSNSTQDYLSH